MAFPDIPFTIPRDDNAADQMLVEYLKMDRSFSYLGDRTRVLVSKLGSNGLHKQKKEVLLDLWSTVLEDALRTLKMHDSREWDRGVKGVDYASFFHAGSLGVTELGDVLKSFAKFESMLYGASPNRYRDHIAHAFRVWLCGHGILQSTTGFKGVCVADSLFDHAIEREEWACMWAIAALCHDLGYPLQHIDRINKLARETLPNMGLIPSGDLRFTFSQQMLPFHDTILRMMASRPVKTAKPTSLRGRSQQQDGYQTHVQNKYYLKLLKSFDGLEHGVVSALLISRALVYFLESDLSQDTIGLLDREDARQFVIRREILRAIAAHTCQDLYHLQFNSLSFLLYIVDEMQCWGRPTLEELQHQPTGAPAAEATVKAFNSRRVAVCIRTPASSKWTDRDERLARVQLEKLKRMLRLGVGTAMLRDHYLEFTMLPGSGSGLQLLLRDGRIGLNPTQAAGRGTRPRP